MFLLYIKYLFYIKRFLLIMSHPNCNHSSFNFMWHVFSSVNEIVHKSRSKDILYWVMQNTPFPNRRVIGLATFFFSSCIIEQVYFWAPTCTRHVGSVWDINKTRPLFSRDSKSIKYTNYKNHGMTSSTGVLEAFRRLVLVQRELGGTDLLLLALTPPNNLNSLCIASRWKQKSRRPPWIALSLQSHIQSIIWPTNPSVF